MKIVLNPKGDLEQRKAIIQSFVSQIANSSYLEVLWIKSDEIRSSFYDVFPEWKHLKVVEKRYISSLNRLGQMVRTKQLESYKSAFEIQLGDAEINTIATSDLSLLKVINGFSTIYIETSQTCKEPD